MRDQWALNDHRTGRCIQTSDYIVFVCFYLPSQTSTKSAHAVNLEINNTYIVVLNMYHVLALCYSQATGYLY